MALCDPAAPAGSFFSPGRHREPPTVRTLPGLERGMACADTRTSLAERSWARRWVALVALIALLTPALSACAGEDEPAPPPGPVTAADVERSVAPALDDVPTDRDRRHRRRVDPGGAPRARRRGAAVGRGPDRRSSPGRSAGGRGRLLAGQGAAGRQRGRQQLHVQHRSDRGVAARPDPGRGGGDRRAGAAIAGAGLPGLRDGLPGPADDDAGAAADHRPAAG